MTECELNRTDTIAHEHGAALPVVSLPKGDGAIRGMGEKFTAPGRPIETHPSANHAQEILVSRNLYGETQTDAEAANLRGKVYQSFDGAGVVTNEAYDFKGSLIKSSRQLAAEYKATLDWSATVTVEPEVFTTQTTFDALNRPVEMIAPDNSTIRPSYNEANLLEQVEANLRGSATITTFVNNIDYDAKGQRERIDYGNGVFTTYEYDPDTFRLSHLQTVRGTEVLQNLSYTYDPIGNISHIRDDAQQTIFFRNQRVEPSNDYTYDAIYRLIAANGREHLGQTGNQINPPTAPDAFNAFSTGLTQPGDGNAMGTYLESYVYDAVGNILAMQHRGSNPSNPGWTRTYSYNEASLLEASKTSNRLSSTQVGNSPLERHTYDEHGSMTTMSHLPLMRWNYLDQLEASSQQVVNSGTPETTYYIYDSAGQRVRKVTERQAGETETATRTKERIYLGAFEIYREYELNGSSVKLERETLHIMDANQRLALVENRTRGNDESPLQLVRYQFTNHLRSATLELDQEGRTISYQEYYPFGATSYCAMDAVITSSKRYRFSGKERDEETGLIYYGMRYYPCWLGLWCSADPGGLNDGPNLYVYTRNNPILYIDPDGRSSLLWLAACNAPPPQGPPNQVAVAGFDSAWGVRKSFRESAELPGFTVLPESPRRDRVRYDWDDSVIRTGREFIETLRQQGSVAGPITDINITSHGAPYAIDFGTARNNLYISEDDVRTVVGDPSWMPGPDVAYISDLRALVDTGIVAEDVTITMNSCLCAAIPETVPKKGEVGYHENNVKWADLNKGVDFDSANNIARAISEALPKATIIASKYRVDSGVGIIDAGRVVYKGGKKVDLTQQQATSPASAPEPAPAPAAEPAPAPQPTPTPVVPEVQQIGPTIPQLAP